MSARQELIALKNQIEQAVPGGSKYFRFLDELEDWFCKFCNGKCFLPEAHNGEEKEIQLPEGVRG